MLGYAGRRMAIRRKNFVALLKQTQDICKILSNNLTRSTPCKQGSADSIAPRIPPGRAVSK